MEYTEFFLDEEVGSGTSSNRDQYCKISPNITTESFSAFLQTLLKVYKPPSSENYFKFGNESSIRRELVCSHKSFYKTFCVCLMIVLARLEQRNTLKNMQ